MLQQRSRCPPPCPEKLQKLAGSGAWSKAPSCSSGSGAERAREEAAAAVVPDTLSSPPPLLASACRASSTFQGNVKLLSKHYAASQTHTKSSVREDEAAVLCPAYSVF